MKKEWIELDGKIEKVNDDSYIIAGMSHKKLMELFNKGILYYIITDKERNTFNNTTINGTKVEKLTKQALKGENIIRKIDLYTDNELQLVNNSIPIESMLKMANNRDDINTLTALRNAFQKNYDDTHKCTVTININK